MMMTFHFCGGRDCQAVIFGSVDTSMQGMLLILEASERTTGIFFLLDADLSLEPINTMN
ncbi:unnamed protein product [Musa acuminata subsp. burmannicoides]